MPNIRLRGTFTCPPERLAAVRAALPDHVRLTRAEPGCLSFEVTETAAGPLSAMGELCVFPAVSPPPPSRPQHEGRD